MLLESRMGRGQGPSGMHLLLPVVGGLIYRYTGYFEWNIHGERFPKLWSKLLLSRRYALAVGPLNRETECIVLGKEVLVVVTVGVT